MSEDQEPAAVVERVGDSILVTLANGATLCMGQEFALDFATALLKVVHFGADQLDQATEACGEVAE